MAEKSSPFKKCEKCGSTAHQTSKCKPRLFPCKWCKEKVANFAIHNPSCPKKGATAKTNRATVSDDDSIEEVEVSQNGRVELKGVQYIPLVTTVSAVAEKGPIPLVAYGDTGARRSIIQEDFYREHLQPLNFQAYKDRMIRVKGVDPSGKGILTDRRVKMTFQTPNGTLIQHDPILMPGLPEQMLFGLDWMGKAKLQIHTAEEPENCRLVSKSAGINEPFTSEREYQALQDAIARSAATAIIKGHQAEIIRRVTLTNVSPDDEASGDQSPITDKVFQQRSAPSEAKERDQKC